MSIRKAFAIGLLALTPALTGCYRHTHSVLKTRLPDIVLSTSLDHLLDQINQRDQAIQNMTASIQIVATEGGSRKGEVTEYISFSGYIVIGKPENIDVILKLPYVFSDALHMVSDGKSFKMLMPPKDCAFLGSDTVPSTQTGLYSLRPAVILDSLLIHGVQPDQVISMTQDSWTPPQPKNKNGIIEDPDYDIEFLSQPHDQVEKTFRVVHIDRVNLLPWRQDIYNSDGKVATQAIYSNYKKFGDIMFPTKIEIQRPLDELSLTLTISKPTFNQKSLPDDQFTLDIPPATAHVINMDDPASGSIKDPCAAHAPQSTH